MLERVANPNKPPMTLDEIKSARTAFAEAGSDEEEDALKLSLTEMEAEFRRGRGSLADDFSPEILAAIDKCFVDIFLVEEEPVKTLFYPNSGDGLDLFIKYFDEVDLIFQSFEGVPMYAREYFAFFSIWQMQPNVYFPLPLGTASVVSTLHKMMGRVRRGMTEVRAHSYSTRF